MKSRTFAFVVALFATGSLFASVTEEETFSYKLNDGGRFCISNVNGSIIVNVSGGYPPYNYRWYTQSDPFVSIEKDLIGIVQGDVQYCLEVEDQLCGLIS